MSWFTTKTATPNRASVRQQEIGILTRTVRDLNWYVPDQTCIKTIMVGQIQLPLSIHIPEDYPQKPPVLRVLNPAQHQWLDSQGFLTLCPAVANWNPNSPSLVSLIQFIEAKFRETPPILLSTQGFQQQQPQQQQQQQQQPLPPGAYPSPGYNPGQSNAGYGQYQPPVGQYQPNQSQSQAQTPRPEFNNSMSYVPPVPSRGQVYAPPPAPGGGYSPRPQTPSYNQSQSQGFPQSSTPSPSSPIPKVETPSIQYASQAIARPSTPQQPPEPPIQLAAIPHEPPLDRAMIKSFPISKLEQLDGDIDQIKAQVGQNPVINQMFESLLRTQQEVDDLQQTLNRTKAQAGPIQGDILAKQAAIGAKEAEFANLKRDYEAKAQQYDVAVFITDLQKQLFALDDEGDDIVAKFTAIRNPSEEELGNFLENYEKVRQEYHLKSIIMKKLKMNLVK